MSDSTTVIEQAEREFIEASVAVWREIDKASALASAAGIGYAGIEDYEHGIALRKAERQAWERYRDLLSGVRFERFFKAKVVDAGGGEVRLLVHRNTMNYPPLGAPVTVIYKALASGEIQGGPE